MTSPHPMRYGSPMSTTSIRLHPDQREALNSAMAAQRRATGENVRIRDIVRAGFAAYCARWGVAWPEVPRG